MPPTTISTRTSSTRLTGSPSRASLPSPPPPSSSSSTSHLRILILEPAPKPFCSDSQHPPSPSLIPPLLHVLTGEPPHHLSPTICGDGGSGGHDDGITQRQSFAGYTTHPPLAIRTRYFDRRVCIWCDEVPLPRSFSEQGRIWAGKERPAGTAVRAEPEEGGEGKPTTQTWLRQMLSPEPEAVEVRSVIGVIVLVLSVQDAVELGAAPTDKSTLLGGPDDDDNDEHNTIYQRTSHSSLRQEYLDIVEAVNTLRSTIVDERTAHDNTVSGDENGTAGDVAAVILLQGLKPQPQNGLPTRAAPAPVHDDADDILIETVEDQLLTDRQILGWDVVFWDGRVAATTTSGAEDKAGGGGGGGSGAESSTEENGATTKTTTTTTGRGKRKRNIYGEMIGIDRLREVLEGIDWTALPPGQPPPSPPPSSSSSSSSSFSSPFHHHHHLRRQDFEIEIDTNHPPSGPPTYPDALLGRGPDYYPLGEDLDFHHRGRKGEKGGDDDDDDDEGEGEGDGDGDAEHEAAQVEQLQGLLQQTMAIRQAGAELPSGAERDRYARRMVGRLMREL